MLTRPEPPRRSSKARDTKFTRVLNKTTAASQLPEGIVKSAGRVLQILELFDMLQRESTILEVSRLLGFPQSSTSMLLRSLVELGYLNHDPAKRTYKPTISVTLLGNWISANPVGAGVVLPMMKRLHQQTGLAVTLATRTGLLAKYVRVIRSPSSQAYVTQNSLHPLVRSGVGHAFLAIMNSNDEIRRIAHLANAATENDAEAVAISELIRSIEQTRRRGYALTSNLLTVGGGELAIAVPSLMDGSSPIVLGLAGSCEAIASREAELLHALHDAVQTCCCEMLQA